MTRDFSLPGRSSVMAMNAMAATSHPLATETALAVLRDGGNAVDAAIAASATLCVVEPHMTGVGGDCFVLLREPDGSLHGLNGSGRSSAKADLDYFIDNRITKIEPTSVHSVTAPGAVRAWEELHQRFGAMDFARLFADAVRHAREGHPVHARVASDWKEQEAKLAADAHAPDYLLIDGRAPVAGELMRLPALGDVLETIATRGARSFYEGPIAQDIAAVIAAKGGHLDESDLAAVSVDWVEPISVSYGGHEIHEIPPNGQGITALLAMRMIEHHGLPQNPDSAQRQHLQIELARLAYAVRDQYVGDIDHMAADPAQLLSDTMVDRLSRQFDPDRRNDQIKLPSPTHSDTVYISIVDADRRCVSFINSIFSGFGSGIVTQNTGIALQNRGSSFVVEPGHANCIGPAKRPMHTIIPAMVTKGEDPAYCFGVMGGSYQPMGHVQVLTDMIDYGFDPQAALDRPRIFWDEDQALRAETGVTENVRSHLRACGHVVHGGGLYGGGQIIRIDSSSGALEAGSDPRKDGQAGGY